MNPQRAAWILTSLFAVAISASVYRIPIQVSDSLEVLEGVDALPSVTAAFTSGLHASRTMLRPMRQAQTKVLLETAHALGDRYNLVFRGFHAATAALLVALFTWVARPRTWIDFAALAFALTVLTGLHTFAGMMREAYPINHFLLVALECLAVFALAQSQGGVTIDVLACVLFVAASLTLESGLLVWPVAVAAYVSGLRGISRGALVAMTVLAAGYVALRIGGLHMIGNTVGERQTGFGTMMLSTDDLRARFGNTPLLLYAYTVVCSALTVPFSQPIAGQWTALGAAQNGDLQLFYLNDIGTSLAATALVAWYLVSRTAPYSRRRWREPIPLAAITALAGSALLSYAYAKSEIMSAAGVFYALVVYLAAAEAVRLVIVKPSETLRPAVLVLALFVTSAWAFRAVGLHYKLQRGAFEARSEWVIRMPPYRDLPIPAEDARLAPRLRDEALHRGRTNPFLLWPRLPRLWGEI